MRASDTGLGLERYRSSALRKTDVGLEVNVPESRNQEMRRNSGYPSTNPACCVEVHTAAWWGRTHLTKHPALSESRYSPYSSKIGWLHRQPCPCDGRQNFTQPGDRQSQPEMSTLFESYFPGSPGFPEKDLPDLHGKVSDQLTLPRSIRPYYSNILSQVFTSLIIAVVRMESASSSPRCYIMRTRAEYTSYRGLLRPASRL